MMFLNISGRSEQFTTAAGEVIPEQIVPASLSVNVGAAAAVVVVAAVIARSR